MKDFLKCLIDRRFAAGALRVALIVGSLLFCINHGAALLTSEMNTGRWLSAALSYLVPYIVNIHGRWVSQRASLVRHISSPDYR